MEMGQMARLDGYKLLALLEKLDGALSKPTRLCIIGSCALLLMGHNTRSTEDVDIWLPASDIDGADLARACRAIGVGFNPTHEDAGEAEPYLQVVQPGIVTLPKFTRGRWSTGQVSTTVWKGKVLEVTIPPAAVLVASKLVRCEDRDLADCAYVMSRGAADETGVKAAIQKIPASARQTAAENVVLLGLLAKAA
jgi:hypothetical protein